jgi:hypothetical protein
MPTNISTDYCVELLINGCENITPAFGPVFADWPDSGKRIGHGRSDDRLGSRAKPIPYARLGPTIQLQYFGEQTRKEEVMSRWLFVLIMCTVALPLVCQTSKYQTGTITAVSAHASQAHDGGVTQYDVSVKVGDTLYVVLYTAHSGSGDPKFAVGTDKLVLVGSDTVTFNDVLGKTAVVPILRREALPAQPTLDWSQAPSKYFSMKLQHLSERLDLSESQKDKIKPILEQEAGEAGQIVANPVLSSKDKLNRLEKIVQSSDKKLRTFLSAEQWQTLQSIRKDQKQELKQRMAAKKPN